MSEEEGMQVSLPPRPTEGDPEAWKMYWEARGQPWRTEPEISTERQEELAQRRTIVPNIQKGIYPFKEIKLSRADVEWLLATHENGRGPVEWKDENQQECEGLDLRGADLCEAYLDGLPLARMRGGLTSDERLHADEEQRNMATVLLEKAYLGKTQLQEADLGAAQLQGAKLYQAQLQKAHLERAQLQKAHLEGQYRSIKDLTNEDYICRL